jgi:hypothetical protein
MLALDRSKVGSGSRGLPKIVLLTARAAQRTENLEAQERETEPTDRDVALTAAIEITRDEPDIRYSQCQAEADGIQSEATGARSSAVCRFGNRALELHHAQVFPTASSNTPRVRPSALPAKPSRTRARSSKTLRGSCRTRTRCPARLHPSGTRGSLRRGRWFRA